MFNNLNNKVTKAPIAFITIALFIAFFTLCCGKRKPPVPPTERVPQRTTISGIQQGNQIILSWKMPARNTSENDTDFIKRIDVFRLAEPIDSPEQINEEDFSSRATLIDSIIVNEEDFSFKTFTYSDNLEFSAQSARLRYAVKFVNNSGQKASFSNFLTIQPSPRIAKNPESLLTEITQDSVILKWEKPSTNVDGSTPVNILGFNVYRKAANEPQALKLNNSPVSDTQYEDNFFEFEKTYAYSVRTLSIGSQGEPVESISSSEVEITTKDIFPPSPPESITIAASPDSISLFFATNTEKDISGYQVFRSTDNSIPLESWELLTKEPIETNTFSDRNIRSGIKYFYYLKAVDKFKNISQPSQIVNETAP